MNYGSSLFFYIISARINLVEINLSELNDISWEKDRLTSHSEDDELISMILKFQRAFFIIKNNDLGVSFL